MTTKVKLTEMKNADVTHISLVKRAASRLPIRIIKSDPNHPENTMLNLTNIGRAFKSAPAPKDTAPTVTAIAVNSPDEATTELVGRALKEAGFDIVSVTKSEDGVTMFVPAGGEVEEGEAVSVIKMDADVALVLKGFSPYSDELSKGSFGELAASRGFYSSVRNATETLSERMDSDLRNAPDKAAAVQKSASLLSDFNTYVSKLLDSLPEKAFKMESVVVEAIAQSKVLAEEKAKATKDGEAEGDKKVEKADDTKVDGEAKPEDKKVEDAGKKVEKGEGPDFAALLKEAMAPMTEMVTGLTQKVDGLSTEMAAVKKAQADVTETVDQIARKAETASQAVRTTVLAGAKASDSEGDAQPARKADSDWRSGAFDSAFPKQ